ncbi:MAG: hypothetical protein DRO18_07855 [Thermoprotei archaeon]|nr:MAG: hypothetical protein DRO18_07855 [Thermoprotei archaeon]
MKIHEIALREFIHALLKGIDTQVKGCIKYRLKCRDPPAVTSSFLRFKLNYTEFRVKRFWRIAKAYHGYSLNVYRLRDAWFHLVILPKKGVAFTYDNYELFPDMFDCMRISCTEYPNENLLYIYLEGSLGGEALRLNLVYVLKKLFEVKPLCYETIIEGVKSMVSKGSYSEIVKSMPCIFRLLREYGPLLSEILPVIPKTLNDLLLISPALGSIFLRLGIRVRKK